MKLVIFLFAAALSLVAMAAPSAHYNIKRGQLHEKGKVLITILPDKTTYKVQMDYKLNKKALVPVPDKLLKGKTVMEFPLAFKTEAGYKILEKQKTMTIPKAVLKFLKRADSGDLKNAYFVEVLPTNKKSKIQLIYHPSLPSVGWSQVKITFLSNIPILDGYEVDARLKSN